MNELQLREREIFETLKKLKNIKFVVVGGYAVNAYTLPRFSVDCDIVVQVHAEAKKLEVILVSLGYKKVNSSQHESYHGDFERFEKAISNGFKVSFDILIKEIFDRQTGSSFSSDWVFENSSLEILKGKTITEGIKLKIIDIDALFVMKSISCRQTDIRDVFMLSPSVKDKGWIRNEISLRYDLNDRLQKIKDKITSKQFKDDIQGISGFIDEKVFEKHKKAILSLFL